MKCRPTKSLVGILVVGICFKCFGTGFPDYRSWDKQSSQTQYGLEQSALKPSTYLNYFTRIFNERTALPSFFKTTTYVPA